MPVSDKYGLSVRQFSRDGQLIRNCTILANVVPRNTTTGPFYANDDGNNNAGRGTTRSLEGLAIGPRLNNGSYLLLAGTDNDYSVTQNSSAQQQDVWFDFSLADPYAASIQCPLDQTTGCVKTSNGSVALWSANLRLLPGVLHAYSISAAELGAFAAPVPEPGTWALMLGGLAGVAGCGAVKRRRAAQPAG